MRRRTTGLSVLATLLVGGAVGMVALQGGLGTTGGDSALVRRLLAFVAPEEESGARDMRGDVLTANGTGQQRQQHLPHGTIEGALLPSNRASPAYLQQYAREHDERRLVDAIRSCSAAQAPATSAAAPGNTAAPERLTDNLRTVMREGA
jgi:hypothetical protein